MTRHTRFATAIVLVIGATAALSGQPEKVTLRMAPRPDQTVHTTMTQEIDVDMVMEGAAGLPPIKMLMRSTIGMTQKNGTRKADGSIDANVTYDQISVEMSMNGQVAPVTEGLNDLLGRTIVVTYSADGAVVEVKGLPAGITGDVVRRMMTSTQGNLPTMTLAVGEATTSPLDMALPLPLPGAAGVKMTGETVLKLISIDTDPEGRSARLATTTRGKMATDDGSPAGQGSLGLGVDMRIDGDGMSVIDLDTGVVRSSVMNTTMGGKISNAGGAGAPMTGMTIRGTMKATITSTTSSAGK